MILALDIGGTKTSIALIDDQQSIIEKKTIATQFPDWISYSNALKNITNVWQFDQVLVATTGRIVDGILRPLNTKMIPFWNEFPIKASFEALFKKPVLVVNDAAAAAWGEFNNVRSKGINNLLYLTISTGVGSGLIINDRLVTSNNGLASHAGHAQHSLANVEITTCSCGRTNCIETIASGTSIAKRASLACGEKLSAIDVFEKYSSNMECNRVIQESAKAIADLILDINVTVGLDLVVLGGGVGLTDIYQNAVKEYLDTMPDKFSTPITSASLGVDSGLLGISALAIEKIC